MLREKADLIGGLARIPARPATVLAGDAAGLAAGIRALPADIGAVLLTGVLPERAREVRRILRDGRARPLVTEEDLTAIALVAAALGSPAGAGQRTHRRMVLAGAGELPVLATLLMASGVHDITTWNQCDAIAFPLYTIMFGADTVIDLVGELPSRADNRLAGITVITPEDAIAAPYAAAGLLSAALHTPGLDFDVETYRLCALVLATQFDKPVSRVRGVALTRLVADTATSAFHSPHSR